MPGNTENEPTTPAIAYGLVYEALSFTTGTSKEDVKRIRAALAALPVLRPPPIQEPVTESRAAGFILVLLIALLHFIFPD